MLAPLDELAEVAGSAPPVRGGEYLQAGTVFRFLKACGCLRGAPMDTGDAGLFDESGPHSVTLAKLARFGRLSLVPAPGRHQKRFGP